MNDLDQPPLSKGPLTATRCTFFRPKAGIWEQVTKIPASNVK
jgi:hypothetical protein